MKRILSLIALAASCLMAGAQQYQSTTVWGAVGTNLVPSTVYNLAVTDGFIGVTDYEDFILSVTCSWSNHAKQFQGDILSPGMWLMFYPSISGTIGGVSSNTPYAWHILCNTNNIYERPTYSTNLTDFGYGYMKLAYISNNMTLAHVTNIVVKLTVKPNKREYR